jgi:hypothetical protein
MPNISPCIMLVLLSAFFGSRATSTHEVFRMRQGSHTRRIFGDPFATEPSLKSIRMMGVLNGCQYYLLGVLVLPMLKQIDLPRSAFQLTMPCHFQCWWWKQASYNPANHSKRRESIVIYYIKNIQGVYPPVYTPAFPFHIPSSLITVAQTPINRPEL